MRTVELALVGIVLLGVGLIAYGSLAPGHTHGIYVEGPLGEDDVEVGEAVAYEDLSGTEREAFDRARAAEDGQIRTDPEEVDVEVVDRDGEYYRVRHWASATLLPVLASNLGWLLGTVGVILIVAYRSIEYVRGREEGVGTTNRESDESS